MVAWRLDRRDDCLFIGEAAGCWEGRLNEVEITGGVVTGGFWSSARSILAISASTSSWAGSGGAIWAEQREIIAECDVNGDEGGEKGIRWTKRGMVD